MAKDKIEEAIQITELKQDLANLIRQGQAISGAIQYIQQKLTQLDKPPQKGELGNEPKQEKNGKSKVSVREASVA